MLASACATGEPMSPMPVSMAPPMPVARPQAAARGRAGHRRAHRRLPDRPHPDRRRYTALADRFLRDSSLADFIADANDGDALTAGRLVVVPLKPINASNVFADGYQTVPILCYHQFTTGRSTDLMIMPRDSFVAQMEYLKKNDYNVITLADLEGFLKASRPDPAALRCDHRR
jgi:hypothetical protein